MSSAYFHRFGSQYEANLARVTSGDLVKEQTHTSTLHNLSLRQWLSVFLCHSNCWTRLVKSLVPAYGVLCGDRLVVLPVFGLNKKVRLTLVSFCIPPSIVSTNHTYAMVDLFQMWENEGHRNFNANNPNDIRKNKVCVLYWQSRICPHVIWFLPTKQSTRRPDKSTEIKLNPNGRETQVPCGHSPWLRRRNPGWAKFNSTAAQYYSELS